MFFPSGSVSLYAHIGLLSDTELALLLNVILRDMVLFMRRLSPIAKLGSFCLLISFAANLGWLLFQLDVKNTFLLGDILEEVYMEQPHGFVAQKETSHLIR